MDSRQRLLLLAKDFEPAFREAFVDAIRVIKSETQLTLLVGAVESGRVDDVLRVLQMRPESFSLLEAKVQEAFLQGAAYQIGSVPKK